MRIEAHHRPLLLQNRISIQIRGDSLPPNYSLSVIERLREIYEENITSVSQLLPRRPDGMGYVLECYTYKQGRDIGRVGLSVGVEGDRVTFRVRQGLR